VKKKFKWSIHRHVIGRISHIEDDWLTPAEYLPYIYALLGEIDLDPCSTHNANVEFLRAKKIYTLKDDGINIQEPWKGITYLFPPSFGRCAFNKERGTWRWSLQAGTAAKAPSVIWFRRLLREWKLRNIPEALFYTIYPEMMRICPEIWDFPMCMPTKRADLIHGKDLYSLKSPIHWGYFIYLPTLELGSNQTERFKSIFSHLGKIVC
tara:strand:- start:382 stop:1005 length:624 start_codon:yes stop_codon:yes gene_type:complete